MNKKINCLKLLLLATVFVGCSASISPFDQYAYVQDTSLKVDALNMMSKAKDSASLYEKDIEELTVKIDKAYEFEKSRPLNSITTKMWEKLKDPNSDLLGGFLTLWEKDKICSDTFISEKKKQVGEAFDQIIELESKKIKQ